MSQQPSDRDGSVARITLIVGPEPVLADRVIAGVESASRRVDPELQVVRAAAEEAASGRLDEVVAPSLFGETLLLVVTGLEALTADTSADFLRILDELPEHVRLVVTHSGAGNRATAALKAVRAAADDEIAVVEVRKPGERVDFIRAEFAAARRQISPDAARALSDAVGPDLRELASACAQLLSDTTGRVEPETVRRYYAGRADVKGWEVADAAVEGRVADALSAMRSAVGTGTAAVVIVGALATSLRTLARAAAMPRGIRPADAARDLGVPPWKVDVVRRQSRGWSQRGLADALVAVATADAALKGGVDGLAEGYALERAVVGVARARQSEE